MKAGRKPTHAFNTLKVGQKAILTGSAETYPHQFIGQFNKTKEAKLKVVRKNGKVYAERIS